MYLFYLIVLLSLGCPQVKGTEVPDPKNELDLDQVATASENVAHAKVQREKKSKDYREQLIASVSGTVHYENSNGFVPMVPAHEPKKRPGETGNGCQNSTRPGETKSNTTRLIIKVPDLVDKEDPQEIEDDPQEIEDDPREIEDNPAYSTEARLFLNLPQSGTNRRSSYDFQEGTNEFELLKVRNNTPAIANYQEFYENLQNRVNEARNQEENRLQGGGMEYQTHQGVRGAYQDQDRQKPSHRVKVEDNYHRQEYDGHGHTGAEQNSPSRTRVKDQTFDNVADASKTQHRFTRPVVVADLGNYPSRPVVDPGPGYKTSRVIEATSSEAGQYTVYSRDGRYRGYDDSRDDDSLEYGDYNDRPRHQKGRRRPYSDHSQRLPKEHRGSSEEDEYEHEVRGSSRSKGHRHRGKMTTWVQADRTRPRDESLEQTRYEGRLTGSETKGRVGSRFRPSTAWNQVSPNVEVSHSSGVEIDQLEKPKLLLPLNVNLVPVTNFDHATALGNSQGFDVSNAILQNYVTAGPIVTTSGQMFTDNLRHVTRQHQEASTSAPDVIIGQKSVHNTGQTVLVPQTSDQNKYSRSQYVSSTLAPVFAVTPGQGLQGVSIQNVQATVTPRTTYVASPSPSSNVQETNDQIQSSVPHLLLPQPTLQTFPSVVPVQTNQQYSIQVNTHGLHGQNLVNQGGMQNIPVMTTVAPTSVVPVTKVSLVKPDSSGKKTIVSGNSENYYTQYQNALANLKQPQTGAGLYQVLRNYPTKGKAYIQTTHIVPAVLQPLPTLGTVQAGGHQLVPEQTVQNFVVNRPNHQSGNAETVQQFQLQVQRDQLMKSTNLPGFTYQIDSLASQSNNNANTAYTSGVESAHLPNVGTRNVEIANPNLNLSPVQTGAVVNAYEPIQYPAAVLTTPIPMFTTTGFVTARPAIVSTTTPEPINLQSFMDSLSEMNQANNGDLNSDHNQDRPMFNPINFVPNMDLLNSQNALNGKHHMNDHLQQNLNLVPLIPGGNFFKPSYTAQSELLSKPKLTSDLEKYADQMFRESLNTIYNSHKWNNDRRRPNVSEIDLAKLRQELQRLRASLPDPNKNQKDHYHPSESKIKTTEAHKGSLKDQLKSNDQLLAALEQILKSQSASSSHHRPGHGQRHTDQSGKHFSGGPHRDNKHPRDFMTPPKRHSHRSKPFNEKPGKKRPGPRFNHHHHHHHHHHGSRSRPSTLAPKSSPDTAASSLDVHRSPFDTDETFDLYPSFTTPSAEILTGKQLKNRKYPGGKDFDMNHPRTHNLLGLLMKNKQLPPGQGVFRDREQIQKFFEDEKRRLQQQFYDDAMREYLVNGVEGRPFQEKNAG